MTDEKPHKSRRAWPGPMSIAGVGKGHTHDLPRTLLTILKALVGAVVALLLIVGLLTYYVLQMMGYVQGRGAYRDAEADRLNERINESICDLLDQLPEGGLLDRPREKYGCGEGIPLSELPEDVRRRYQGVPSPDAAPAPATPTTEAPMGSAAIPNPPRPAPNPPPPSPAAPTTEPTPSPSPAPPADPLNSVVETVCDLLPICPEEP